MTANGPTLSRAVKQVGWTLAAGLTFNDLIGSIIRIDGRSMQPTLNPDVSSWSDWVLVEKLSIKLLRRYSRGDVVILLSPEQPSERLVKRVIAVEGDTLTLLDTKEVVRIPQGRCWIEGDNTTNSGDSRNCFGPVHLGLLEGRVTHVVWPPWRMGVVEPNVPSSRKVVAAS